MTIALNRIEELSSVFQDVSSVVANTDYQRELGEFQQIIVAQEAEMFGGQKNAGGTPWAPLKPATIKRKRQNRILYDTGALMASLTNVGGSGNVHEAMPRELVFGTDIEYAGYLQEGTSKMPARPPFGLSETTLAKLAEMIADATVEKLKTTH